MLRRAVTTPPRAVLADDSDKAPVPRGAGTAADSARQGAGGGEGGGGGEGREMEAVGRGDRVKKWTVSKSTALRLRLLGLR